ncbi:hypothetical protein AQJ11_02980 [Streptomyces corchorusii]|uniref:Uncharacterized protein n=2 Tax=Streptomyces TaxID=1883 RepID=A0A101QMA5_STRCK|nr:hypothetical protein [Streptomyces corchorusii]KUN32506.1 hypothetical protein AQJ11_02980 [Streptomyces corchorusii]
MTTEPTDLQLRALAIIAAGDVRQFAAVPHPVFIDSPGGTISPPTVNELVQAGWVRVDSTRSLHDGQAVEITQSGLAHLPGNTVPDIPQAADDPTGDQVLAALMRTVIRHGQVGVDFHDDLVEVTGADDTVLATLRGRFDSPAQLARFLDIDEDCITDAR